MYYDEIREADFDYYTISFDDAKIMEYILKQEKEKLMDAESDMTAQQTQEILDLLENGPHFLDTFDAELFGELVEKIIIEGNDSVRFCLKNGLELQESIERTVR